MQHEFNDWIDQSVPQVTVWYNLAEPGDAKHLTVTCGKDLSGIMRKPTFWFLTWSDTNQAVQLQKMARGLKFRIQKVEGLYYLCSENKGADQLRGYREADLRLCFRICKMLVFS